MIAAKKIKSNDILMAAIIAAQRFPGLRGKNAEAVHVS